MRGLSVCLVGLTAAAAIALGTSWDAPPRFDGAGYAVLARSISEGRGYRSIDHPYRPRHTHFPPGYPMALAAVRRIAGNRSWTLHLFSAICAVGATLAAHRWFRLLYGARTALAMGLALATNWAWVRAGGGIQSEPLFELLGQLAILAAWRAHRRDGAGISLGLGLLLGAAFLTRHVAIALIAAIFLDLALARRWRNLIPASAATVTVAVPWIAWVIWVSARAEGTNQADLLASTGGGGIAGRIASQLLFHARRIPDQLTGPFVEVATIFRRSPIVSIPADIWAASASLIILIGWVGLLRRPRRRLAGLFPLVTLGVLLIWPFTEAGRFLVPMIPCLLIGGVEGIAWILRRLWARPSPWVRHSCRTLSARHSRRTFHQGAAILLLAASLPYSMYDLARGRGRLREAGHRDFDDACAWIAAADRGAHPGPVLTRHPGEVFLRTGRQALEVSTSERPGARDAEPDEVAAAIARYRVAYLLIDDRRYANAPASPLARYAAAHPDRVRKVWRRESADGAVIVLEVDR